MLLDRFWLLRSGMITTKFARFLSTSRVVMGASKSNLAKLRKKTGYPFGNCKKALEVSNNDLEKAEKWLEDQAKALGWSKAMKMENRNTPQGLVGIAVDKQYAAMVEVNCETDFVAKNEKFQRLVDLVAKTCLHHSKVDNPSPKSISKVLLEGDAVGRLLAADQQCVEDHVVRNVGVVGERMVVCRAALVSVHPPNQLVALTHPTGAVATNLTTLMGKYGAVLVYADGANHNASAHVGKQLCQHVIGMNPARIEAPPDEPPPKSLEKKPVEVQAEGEEGGIVIDSGGAEDETVMMRQTFLLDPDRKVADVVAETGITVLDFVRFECGETIPTDIVEATSQAAQAGG